MRLLFSVISASDDELITNFEEFATQVEAEQPDTDLFVLPEAYFLKDVNIYPDILHSLERVSKKTGMMMIVPHVYNPEEEVYYNAIQFVDPKEGMLDKYYAKMELNPFSEYLPIICSEFMSCFIENCVYVFNEEANTELLLIILSKNSHLLQIF